MVRSLMAWWSVISVTIHHVSGRIICSWVQTQTIIRMLSPRGVLAMACNPTAGMGIHSQRAWVDAKYAKFSRLQKQGFDIDLLGENVEPQW